MISINALSIKFSALLRSSSVDSTGDLTTFLSLALTQVVVKPSLGEIRLDEISSLS